MAVLELLSATTRAWIVGARHLVTNDGLVVNLLCRLTRVLACSLTLSLFHLVEVGLLLLIALCVLLGLCLAHLFLLHHGDLTAHEETGDTVVHIVDHLIPDLSALQFEDQQRILLLV